MEANRKGGGPSLSDTEAKVFAKVKTGEKNNCFSQRIAGVLPPAAGWDRFPTWYGARPQSNSGCAGGSLRDAGNAA